MLVSYHSFIFYQVKANFKNFSIHPGRNLLLPEVVLV
jgi:hypothetical protein